MVRKETTLNQDCVLKATVHVCTACLIVSLLTTCLNLNTPPLAQVAPFRCKIRESNAAVPLDTKTQQARLPADSGLYNSTCPSLVNCIFTIRECQSDHHARVQAQHGPDKVSDLSIILAHPVNSQKFPIACCFCFALALALFIALVHLSFVLTQLVHPS